MSLAIAERKAQQKQQRQPGGFVGVFFHLLEWNRRLANRRLFSRRKLLPPVRAVKAAVAAKAFAADEKMPLAKLLLIDDENQDGFPSTKKLDDLGRGMRPPGLVARLMGLESMPVVAHERPRKATYYGCLANREESGGVLHRIDQDLRLESGGIGKQDSRPQKLRKTGGFLERQPIDEGHGKASLPGKKKKTVLSSPSKNKPHKLPSPVKSSRLPPSRLMKAATRIMEPGLQTRGRAKVAITNKDSSIFDAEGIDIVTTLKDSNESFCDSVSESSMTCGRLDGKFKFQPGDGETSRQRIGSSSFDIGNASCSHADIAEGSFSSFALHSEQCNGFEMLNSVQSKIVMQNNVEELGQKDNQSACKTKLDRLSNRLRRNQLRQNQASGRNAISRDKVAFGTKVSSSKHAGRDANKLSSAKGSAFVVRNTSKDSCSKLAYEQNSNRRELDTNTKKKNMSHKRTISTFCGEHVETRRPTSANQNIGINLSDRKGFGQNRHRSVSKRCIKSNSNYKGGDVFGFKNSEIVCFTFNSPIVHMPRSPYKEKEKNRTTNGYINNIDCDATLELDTRSNMISNRIATLRGDELRDLLEEKIKEFTSIDQDLLARAARCFPCLEDLGTAFISEQNEHKHIGACSEKIVMSSCSDSSCFPTQSQDNVKICPASVLDLESSQLSPISMLEATFSNESCSIGSLNASSGGKLQSTDTENELLDSATSVDLRSIVDKIQLLNCITSTANDIHCDVGFSNSKLCEAKHFASNALLLFEIFTSNEPEIGSLDISLESSLLDLLQAVCDTLQIPTIDPCYKGLKGTDQLRELLFDCVIECLDSKYSCSSKSGFMTYLKIPFLLSREKLLEEFDRQIREWMDLAGKFLDDLIKNGMKNSTEKWTVCKMEVFEAGMDLESNILQTLVEEIVTDFC